MRAGTGWTGFNCLFPMKRYCTHKYRDFGFAPERTEANLSAGIGPSGTSLFQFTRSHCAGESIPGQRTGSHPPPPGLPLSAAF